MERHIAEAGQFLWRTWGLLSNIVALGVGIWIDERGKPKPPKGPPHSELPSYDDQLADLFHDERP